MNPGLQPNTSSALWFKDSEVAKIDPSPQMKELQACREDLEDELNWEDLEEELNSELLDRLKGGDAEEAAFPRELAEEDPNEAFLAEELFVLCMIFFRFVVCNPKELGK